MIPHPVPLPDAGRARMAAKAAPYFLSDLKPRDVVHHNICDLAQHNMDISLIPHEPLASLMLSQFKRPICKVSKEIIARLPVRESNC